MKRSIKVIVTGAVEGRLEEVFKKVSEINSSKNGPMDLCVCCGDFFGCSETVTNILQPFRNGSSKIPIRTIFFGTSSKSKIDPELEALGPNGGKLCENLEYFGSLSNIKQVQNIQIASLSCEESSKHAVNQLINSSNPSRDFVDIFISSSIPFGITKNTEFQSSSSSSSTTSTTPITETRFSSSQFNVSKVIQSICPRYCFFSSSASMFFARKPFRGNIRPTRFFTLGKAPNNESQKFLYAISLTPASMMGKETEPQDITESPWKNLSIDQEEEQSQKENENERKRRQPANTTTMSQSQQPNIRRKRTCWFCLGTPEAETHLIVSVGQYSYIAIAKGQMIEGHSLIAPIEHVENIYSLKCKEARKEIDMFCNALGKCFKSKLNGAITVAFERYVPFTNQSQNQQQKIHTHIQCVPIPNGISTFDIEHAFICAAQKLGVSFAPESNEDEQISTDIDSSSSTIGSYFWFRILESGNKRMIARAIPNTLLASFGRDVIASQLLKNEKLSDWRKCVKSLEEETEITKKLKAMFSQFDPINQKTQSTK